MANIPCTTIKVVNRVIVTPFTRISIFAGLTVNSLSWLSIVKVAFGNMTDFPDIKKEEGILPLAWSPWKICTNPPIPWHVRVSTPF